MENGLQNGLRNGLLSGLNNGTNQGVFSGLVGNPDRKKFLENNYSSVFDGVNEYVSIPHNEIIDFERTNQFSISFWIKRNNTPVTNQVIIGKYSGVAVRGYLIWFYTANSDKIQFDLLNSGANRLSVYGNTSITNTSKWYHIVTTYTGNSSPSGVKIYVDGVSETITTGTNTLTNTIKGTNIPFTIANNSDGAFYINAFIDEVSIWNIVLSEEEVKQLYLNTGWALKRFKNNRILWWRGGDGATFSNNVWTFPDASGNGNIGSSVNMEESDRSSDVPFNL